MTVLVAIQVALAVWAYVRVVHDADSGFRFPLPTRVVAMVESVERARPQDQPSLVTALSSESLKVWLTDDAALVESAALRSELPLVERVVDSYLQALGGRPVQAWLAPREGEALAAPRFERMRLWSPHPLRLAVGLAGGGWLMIESTGHHAEAIFGTPPGFWAGVFGALVAAVSLLVLWRGLAPLEPLARSVERFADKPNPVPVRRSGPVETRRVIDAVNRMQDDLSGFIAEREVMFGALSHDLRTYLTRLRLRLDLIADAPMRERAERDVEAMSKIIEDALLLSRLDAASGGDAEPLNLALLVSELGADRVLPASTLGIAEGVDKFQVMGDALSLKRAVENLLDNAAVYGGGPEMRITTDGANVILDVLDRGPGIPPAERERLLRPFERGDDARSQAVPGTGLGLAIAARAAARSGGRLQLLERPGGGLVARMTLPVRLMCRTV
ncbi:MAG: HAMP domain-containing sensor histidine kinase [Pseudomonadota bacterium]